MVHNCLTKQDTIPKVTILLLGLTAFGSHAQLESFAEWRYVDFKFNSIAAEGLALQDGTYDYKKIIIVDVDVGPGGKIFLTVERCEGVPASLTTMQSSRGYGGGPMIKPYPDWSWADVNNCSNIIGSYRIATDRCNRLWVLDSGKVSNRPVCQPKLLSFDMETDELLQMVEIPDEVVYGTNGESLLINIAVDTVDPDCAETDVYIADAMGNGMVVWNGKKFWRIEASEFEPDPNATTLNVKGDESTYLSRGLFGMAVSQEANPLERQFYFRPLSSYDMYQTAALDLHRYKNNQTLIKYKKEPLKLASQSIDHALSRDGILFFSSVDDSAIMCWNTKNEFLPENIAVVAENMMTLQFPSSITLTQSDDVHQTLWVLSNRWQRFNNDDMDFTDVNYRLFTADVNDLVRGTVCE